MKSDNKVSISNIFVLLLVSLISIVAGGYFVQMALQNELSDLLGPSAILISACCAITVGVISLRQSEKYKIQDNTLTVLGSDLLIGKKYTQFESSCETLIEKKGGLGISKALARIPGRSYEHMREIKENCESEYECIRDFLIFADQVCLGVEKGLYDKEMVNRYLGPVFFKTWEAGMLVIQSNLFEYYEEYDKEIKNRRVPLFGMPYAALLAWIDEEIEKQSLKRSSFIKSRAETGIEAREHGREIDRIEANENA